MKLITLSKSKHAIVDDADFEWLNQWKWSYGLGYAVRGKSPHRISMHALILGTPKGFESDHKNGNRLDNRRRNLRIVTVSQNQINRRNLTSNTSGVRGVGWNKSVGKWEARIKINRRSIYIGQFDSLEVAAEHRREAELKYFGAYAPAVRG